VSRVIVRIVVPAVLMRVLSVGLSVVIFMYCADAIPAEHIEINNPKTKLRAANLMKPPFRENGWLGCENS
jgi:hypothetical protein